MNKKFEEDLKYFIEQATRKRGKKLDSDHPNELKHLDFFFLHSKEELDDFVNSYLKKNIVKNKYDFMYMLNCIIKYMSGSYDAHTWIRFDENIFFPVLFYCLDDTIYVERSINEKIFKAKLISINGIATEIIKRELEQSISYGTTGWLLYSIGFKLSNLNVLFSLPSINSKSKHIVYKTDKGTLKFPVNKQMNFNFNIQEDNIIIKDNILVFKYRSCNEKHKPDIKKISKLIISNNIKSFILDLRGNTGGNSSIIDPLIEYLKNSDLSITTLVDRGVFSSGRFAVVDMKKIGSKIVGEDIGTPIDCFGYISKGGKTPNTRLKFNFPKVYWYEDKKEKTMKGIYTKKELQKNKKKLLNQKFLKLDEYIKVNVKEYENTNDDLMLKYCLEIAGSKDSYKQKHLSNTHASN